MNHLPSFSIFTFCFILSICNIFGFVGETEEDSQSLFVIVFHWLLYSILFSFLQYLFPSCICLCSRDTTQGFTLTIQVSCQLHPSLPLAGYNTHIWQGFYPTQELRSHLFLPCSIMFLLELLLLSQWLNTCLVLTILLWGFFFFSFEFWKLIIIFLREMLFK